MFLLRMRERRRRESLLGLWTAARWRCTLAGRLGWLRFMGCVGSVWTHPLLLLQ